MRIHTHIERAIEQEAEAAPGVLELRGGHAQIEEGPVQSLREGGPFGNAREIPMTDRDPRILPELRPRRRHRLRIAIVEQQAPAGTEPGQDRAGMPSAPESGVEINAVRAQR